MERQNESIAYDLRLAQALQESMIPPRFNSTDLRFSFFTNPPCRWVEMCKMSSAWVTSESSSC